ncbi:hypothetical protein Ae356Ps1_6256 [Pseudonocardia sp. Ae356_Ps1]|nr:hypothetical protein Ae356Ps1_6256 [Pseudonocardia sp. Ae356_Ps1]
MVVVVGTKGVPQGPVRGGPGGGAGPRPAPGDLYIETAAAHPAGPPRYSTGGSRGARANTSASTRRDRSTCSRSTCSRSTCSRSTDRTAVTDAAAPYAPSHTTATSRRSAVTRSTVPSDRRRF